MMALALPAGGTDRSAVRWGFSFATVAAAHAAAGLWLVSTAPSADSGFLAGAAVVMIDLPQQPAATPTPPSDAASGPEQSPSEVTPPPKEETKPPEQVADVALPEPEPPKPEPPVEEKQATAPPSVAMAVPDEAPPTAGVEIPQPPSAAVKRWQSGLAAQIARAKRYPPKAAARREQGSARVTFRIDTGGRVVESRILESSGWPDLDQEALLIVARAQPYPKPPADMRPEDFWITFPLNFSLNK